MQPQDPLQPIPPITDPSEERVVPKAADHNPFAPHATRPADVPLQRPEYQQQPQPGQPLQQPLQPAQPPQPYQPIQPAQPQQDYSFILDPAHQAPAVKLPGGDSTLGRAAFFGGALLVLLIIAIVFKNLLAGGSDYAPYISVVQDQQALIHLVNEATEEPSMSTTNKNFAYTAQLSLSSSQSQLVSYLATNKQKVAPKELGLKIKTSLDTQLSDAATASTYNETFKQIMKTQLDTYAADLNTAFKTTKGAKGHTQLTSDYKQALLLVSQLDATTTTD